VQIIGVRLRCDGHAETLQRSPGSIGDAAVLRLQVAAQALATRAALSTSRLRQRDSCAGGLPDLERLRVLLDFAPDQINSEAARARSHRLASPK